MNQNTALTEQEAHSLDSFLLDGTGRALIALEDVFGLNIDSSESDIELATADDSEFLTSIGAGKLYKVTSQVDGDLQGEISLLLTERNFLLLGDAMRPMLSLLFLASPDQDLEALEHEKPAWMQEDACPMPHDESFHHQMMDLLAELGNVLIGVYTNALYRKFRISTSHTTPVAREDGAQDVLRKAANPAFGLRQHVVIENCFNVDETAIRMLCLISPNTGSLRKFLAPVELAAAAH